MPHEKRQKALRKKFNIPEVNTELYNHVWDKEFDKIINNAIATTTDPSKLYDLQECQKVVQQMKGHSFDMIYHAFRLTGCHFTITDSDGKIITKIV